MSGKWWNHQRMKTWEKQIENGKISLLRVAKPSNAIMHCEGSIFFSTPQVLTKLAILNHLSRNCGRHHNNYVSCESPSIPNGNPIKNTGMLLVAENVNIWWVFCKLFWWTYSIDGVSGANEHRDVTTVDFTDYLLLMVATPWRGGFRIPQL